MPITYLDETPKGKITYLDEPQQQTPIPSFMQQMGQGFKNIAEGAINPPYRIAAHTLQGLESFIRGGKATTYTNPITKDVVAPYTNQTKLNEPAGLALQGAALPLNPVAGGAMYMGGGAIEQGQNPVIPALMGAIGGKAIGVASGEPLAPMLGKLSKAGVSKIRDYPANKVNSIRKAVWNKYAPEEYKAYNEGVENLANNATGAIQGDTVVQNLESKLVQRGLMTTEGTLQKGFNPADNRLIKAYQDISRKWANSPDGNLAVKDVINEWRNIRGKYVAKPTPVQRQNIDVANDFFNSISDQISTEDFAKVKARYRTFKENQQMIHEAIDLYAPEMKTARGERFLTKGALSETTQGRKTGKMITEKTGQRLRGAKALTKTEQINPLHWVKKLH
jgi:hypothetical protein